MIYRIVAILLLAATAVTKAKNAPKLTIHQGMLQGRWEMSTENRTFASFRGIPYAKPPTGSLRYAPPEMHEGWQGIRNASVHGNICPQYDPTNFTHPKVVGDEDCLFLNVYTPANLNHSAQYPVMFWIHGGAYNQGSGNDDVYGPYHFMDTDTVLVTINYRIGSLGFFSTEDETAPGNYGIMDTILALKWVKDNVDKFGGDPNLVTIFGESAGSFSVGLLMQSPKAKGLFHRAISMSGSPLYCAEQTPARSSRDIAKILVERLGCSITNSSVECLRKLPAKEIVQKEKINQEDPFTDESLVFGPRVDLESKDPTFNHNFHRGIKSGSFHQVPWINGQTENEGAMFVVFNKVFSKAKGIDMFDALNKDPSKYSYYLDTERTFKDDPLDIALKIKRQYIGCSDFNIEKDFKKITQMLSDRYFTAFHDEEVRLASKYSPVYKYILDYNSPNRFGFGKFIAKSFNLTLTDEETVTSHADDLFYIFKGTVFKSDEQNHPDNVRMSKILISLWTNFARLGYPTTDLVSMPQWPMFNEIREEHMRLNLFPSLGSYAFEERLPFWRQLLGYGKETKKRDEL